MIVRKRVLFFAEPATLAHVVRPLVLASGLDSKHYDVSVATGTDFRHLVEASGLQVRDLWCIGTRAYLAAVAAGRVVYSYKVLERYVDDDLRVIEEARPDVIVGDFRLSLAVSARLSKIPYIGISNAYWSPLARVDYEIPVHPTTRVIGPTMANYVFRLLRPLILAHHSLPMHRLRRKYGMASLGFDLRRVFTEADISVFADVPEMVATADCEYPDRYVYIGPVVWSPKGEIPLALTNPLDHRPLVYVTMGSSGDSTLLNEIVRAVASLECRVAVAMSGSRLKTSFPENVVIADLLPGGKVAAIASLVICNGGSPAAHQSLQQGTPVLGIPANLDQLLNMCFVVASGAGLTVRADRVSPDRIRNAAQLILNDPKFAENARRIATWFGNYLPAERFPALVDKITRKESQSPKHGAG